MQRVDNNQDILEECASNVECQTEGEMCVQEISRNKFKYCGDTNGIDCVCLHFKSVGYDDGWRFPAPCWGDCEGLEHTSSTVSILSYLSYCYILEKIYRLLFRDDLELHQQGIDIVEDAVRKRINGVDMYVEEINFGQIVKLF